MPSTNLENKANYSVKKNEGYEVDLTSIDKSTGKGKTVLVVDDDVDILPLISHLLESASFKPITAESAKEAMAILDEGVIPDLLLTDINMPDMDGFELAMNLKEAKPNIGVVYMSVNSSSYYASYDVENKDEFLQKPFDLFALVDALMNARVLTV